MVNHHTVYQVGGEARYVGMQQMLTQLGVQFEDFQLSVISSLMKMCVDIIYAEEFKVDPQRVFKRHNIDRTELGTMIVAERRIGKTMMVAAFVVLFALFNPGIRIAVYSIGSRASGGLREYVDRFLAHIPGATRRVVQSSTEYLRISATPLPDGVSANSAQARALAKRADTAVLMFFPAGGNGNFARVRVCIWVFVLLAKRRGG